MLQFHHTFLIIVKVRSLIIRKGREYVQLVCTYRHSNTLSARVSYWCGTTIDGEKATVPEQPTKVHHDFKGWYLNGSECDFSKPVTKDITLTASWNGDSSWMYIPVIVIMVLAFFFIFFILFKRRKDDEEEEELQQ